MIYWQGQDHSKLWQKLLEWSGEVIVCIALFLEMDRKKKWIEGLEDRKHSKRTFKDHEERKHFKSLAIKERRKTIHVWRESWSDLWHTQCNVCFKPVVSSRTDAQGGPRPNLLEPVNILPYRTKGISQVWLHLQALKGEIILDYPSRHTLIT